LSANDGWKQKTLPDEEWIAPCNEGLPEPNKNPNARIEMNP
jgi:hypothetical protein